MEYRRLGESGVKVSLLGFGTNNFGSRADYEASERVLHQSLEIGVNHIDSANIYSGGKSEEFIGKALKGKRHQAFIATKFAGSMGPVAAPNMRGASRAHLMESVHASLKRLGTDYIDLYYVHVYDPETPIEETLRGLDDLVRQGKVRYIGSSQLAAWQLAHARWTSTHLNLNRFVCAQNHYNLLKRDVEAELVPYCKTIGGGLIPYFPLASGMLTGKYKQGQPPPPGTRIAKAANFANVLTDRNFKIVQGLEAFAKARGHTVGELAIAWLAACPVVSSIIAGATTPEQVIENAKGLEWKLTADDLKEIDKIAPVA
jgi:aryl-alcohol dehydrogenase-like predicted oxidoreductase